jgi:hypothetical protein
VRSPFARSHVLTPSRVSGRGKFPPSHPELFGVGGVLVVSGWNVESDGDDDVVGVFPASNFWKRRASEARCDDFPSRVNSGEA